MTVEQQRGHLHEVDLFRLLTFASVIAVHVLSATTTPDDVGSNGLQLLLHYTREAFFALTGFVLTYQAMQREARGRGQGPVRFWRRRVPLVAVPYLTWTVVYSFLAIATRSPGTPVPTMSQQLVAIGWDALAGTAWYHLYFLLVTVQLYLVYPALFGVLRRLRARGHLVVALVVVLLQIGVDRLLTDPPAGAFGALLAEHGFATLPAYLAYPVLGAMAALHLDRIRPRVLCHRLAVGAAVLAVGVGVETIYILSVRHGSPPSVASAVFQPVAVAWFLAAVVGLYTACAVTARRWRRGGRAQRWLAFLSDRSFAIFLVHPLVLAGLLPLVERAATHLGAPGTVAVLYVGTVLGSTVAADLLRRLPMSLALTGRPRASSRSAGRRASPPPDTGAVLSGALAHDSDDGVEGDGPRRRAVAAAARPDRSRPDHDRPRDPLAGASVRRGGADRAGGDPVGDDDPTRTSPG